MSLEQEQRIQRAIFKRKLKITLIFVLIAVIAGLSIWYYVIAKPKLPPGEIVSRSGIHWHPQLVIYIKGVKQEIPANIGIGMQYAGSLLYDPMMSMTNMHTHDNSGTLHWEVMDGPVKKDDIKLGVFFSIWGKIFSSTCIFEFCNGPDGQVKMSVNGKENTEFESYLVNDKDKIEIKYE